MELGPLIGVAIACAAILGGQWLEGGRVSSILQPTAALIVVGGTLGAVLLQFSFVQLGRALVAVRQALAPAPRLDGLAATLIALARRARREGLLALERELEGMDEPFLRRALGLAIDGVVSERLREAMELDLVTCEEEAQQATRVFEAAGGYAPTIGILGAVLGLVHVMDNLSDPSRLGGGIAVAFVATLYGVGLANLVFLPIAGKLRQRARGAVQRLEIALEGAVAISVGENPLVVERRLSAFVERPPEAAARLVATRRRQEPAA